MRSSRRPLALAATLVFGLLTAACASTSSLNQARAAEQQQDYDLAVAEYTKAARARPDDRAVRLALDRAKLRAAQDHFARARRHNASGRTEEALIEYQLAAELNPANGQIQDELRTRARPDADAGGARPRRQDHARGAHQGQPRAPLPGADVPADVILPDSLIFRDASARDVFTAIGKFANLSVVFDPAFRDSPDQRRPAQGRRSRRRSTSVSPATRTFWRVTAPRTITIVPDTPAKRREYEEEVVRTFYLSNADLKETIDLLRIVVDARRMAPMTATNAISHQGHARARGRRRPHRSQAIDKARPEVVIDVELLEVDRTRLREYGLQIASPAESPTGIDGQADVQPRRPHAARPAQPHARPASSSPTCPASTTACSRTTPTPARWPTRSCARRKASPAQARFGERVPVPVTTFAPIATGGVNQQPITSFNYENIGVNIDITPRTHHDDEVSLALKIEVSSISGAGFGGLPTFGNREINTVIRLSDGETNMLAGLIRDDERNDRCRASPG